MKKILAIIISLFIVGIILYLDVEPPPRDDGLINHFTENRKYFELLRNYNISLDDNQSKEDIPVEGIISTLRDLPAWRIRLMSQIFAII